MTELKNCPFCGTEPVGPERADSSWWVECEHCEIVMDNASKADLIASWNKRPSNTQMQMDAMACETHESYETFIEYKYCPDCGQPLHH